MSLYVPDYVYFDVTLILTVKVLSGLIVKILLTFE